MNGVNKRGVLSEQDNDVGELAWKRTVEAYDSSLNPGLLGFTGSEPTGLKKKKLLLFAARRRQKFPFVFHPGRC